MAQPAEGNGCGGCLGLFAVILVIALIVMGIISFAALVDPFSWMPPTSEIWADCEDDLDTKRSECALANRFPGFWSHAVVNLIYVAIGAVALIAFAAAVADVRETRAARFDNFDSATEYANARGKLATASVGVALLAMLPIVVALA